MSPNSSFDSARPVQVGDLNVTDMLLLALSNMPATSGHRGRSAGLPPAAPRAPAPVPAPRMSQAAALRIVSAAIGGNGGRASGGFAAADLAKPALLEQQPRPTFYLNTPTHDFGKNRRLQVTDYDSAGCSIVSGDPDSLPAECASGDSTCDSNPTSLRPPLPVRTTLMIRNVPVLYTQEMLAEEWPNDGSYNFMYLPRLSSDNTRGQRNLSYAFLNFVSAAHAMAFREAWQKKRLQHFAARKPLNISYAEVQGLEENLLQLKQKRAGSGKTFLFDPVVVVGGQEVSVDEALEKLGLRDGCISGATSMSPPVAADLSPCPPGLAWPVFRGVPVAPPPGLSLPCAE